MPRVQISWLATRTDETRYALVDAITKSFVEIAKVTPDEVTIIFDEIQPHLRAKGGVFSSDRMKGKAHGES